MARHIDLGCMRCGTYQEEALEEQDIGNLDG